MASSNLGLRPIGGWLSAPIPPPFSPGAATVCHKNIKVSSALLAAAVFSLASGSQPPIKKATHMAFYKWISRSSSNNELSPALSTGQAASSQELVKSDSEDSDTASGSSPWKGVDETTDKDDLFHEDASRKLIEAPRPKRNRRPSRRRCTVNGNCRRGPVSRILRNLNRELPKFGIDKELQEGVAQDDDKTPDLLTEKSSAQVLMSLDKIRDDFCKIQTFAQKIEVEGCHPKTIVNNMCYGQCNSFYIPNHGLPPFRTCGNCEASKTQKLRITLVCPGRLDGLHAVYVDKVLSCRCTSRAAGAHF
ncbi:uncharacterized protein LOC100902224 [Galendromus occidentalis]|uniref:Uncharacterized protein LOC100902224 n=1 Tax=Galendromus occidentalis TaxID=34638 RepID=A0AAJ7L779_9ACAR|nr:uncharacterized protein LOC100902224 [Galendromus occidentalis]